MSKYTVRHVCLNRVRSRLVPRAAQATVRTRGCLDNAIDELFLKVNSLKNILEILILNTNTRFN